MCAIILHEINEIMITTRMFNQLLRVRTSKVDCNLNKTGIDVSFVPSFYVKILALNPFGCTFFNWNLGQTRF